VLVLEDLPGCASTGVIRREQLLVCHPRRIRGRTSRRTASPPARPAAGSGPARPSPRPGRMRSDHHAA
jgi:hypothetical protein